MPFKGWVRGREGALVALIPTLRVSGTSWDLKRRSSDPTPGGQLRSPARAGDRPMASWKVRVRAAGA